MTTMQEAIQHSQALSVARQAIYRFLSLAFLDPKTGAWSRLMDRELINAVRFGAELIRSEESMIVGQLGRGELSLVWLDPEDMLEKLPQSSEKLNEEYEQTFGLVITGASPPYETEYIDGKFDFQRSHNLADISGFYHAFGLIQNEEFPERNDHLMLELEFMASLIGLECSAVDLKNEPSENAKLSRNAQKCFLEQHLSWWVPTFAKGLSKEHPEGFYAAAGKFLTAFLPAERAFSGIEVPVQNAELSILELPEECEGCLAE